MARRMTQQNWRDQADATKQKAQSYPPGPERDTLNEKARELHSASDIYGWLSFPGRQPPR